ncbi:MAG: hypothetical protein WCH40_03025 [Verrucomicrobiales bacterium]
MATGTAQLLWCPNEFINYDFGLPRRNPALDDSPPLLHTYPNLHVLSKHPDPHPLAAPAVFSGSTNPNQIPSRQLNFCVIADFFEEDLVRGAELNISALIGNLRQTHKVTTRRSHLVTPDFINQNDSIWIVSNRTNLSRRAEKALLSKRYYLVENDAGWLASRDFGLYPDFIPPSRQIVHRDLYEGAIKVVMQSKRHEHAINQALHLANTVCSNGNSWSGSDLELFRELNKARKMEGYAVLMNRHPSKGTERAIDYCIKNGLDYKIIPELPRPQYLAEMSRFKALVFFPEIFESYGRVAAEMCALGGSIITNDKLSFRYEEHSSLKGLDLVNFMEANNQSIVRIFE